MTNRGNWKKRVGVALALSLALGAIPSALAQSGDSRGREFWLAFMPNWERFSITIELHLTSEVPTEVTVEYPAIGPTFQAVVALTPGDITTVTLPIEASNAWSPDAVLNNVVHAVADDPFIAYMINRGPATSDAALAVPQSGMGTEYFVAGYPGSGPGESEFTVIASEDATTVTIIPSVPLGSHAAGVPYDVLLDPGEAYHAAAGTGGPDDTTGTHVVADRPIGLTNGHKCVNVPQGIGACDHVFEVAQPVASWGANFILLAVPDRPNGSQFRLLGSVDGTQVFLDGTLVGEVDRGGVLELGFIGPAHRLEATEPVFAIQFIPGVIYPGSTTGDPAMGNVVPLEQFLTAYTFSTVGGAQYIEHYLQITAETADVGAVLLDGAPVDPAEFTAVPGSSWSVATLAITEGAHRTVSPGPHGVQVLGYNAADSYLFPGGTQLADLNCSITVAVDDAAICSGQDAVLDASALELRDCVGGVDLEWRDAGGLLLGTDPVLLVSPTVTTEYEVTATCRSDPACSVADPVTVFVNRPPAFGTPSQVDLSNCHLGLRVSWADAVFQSAAGGVYNIYRSVGGSASCADALSRPAVAAGLDGNAWVDTDTVDGESYVYVVEAEDASLPTACLPVGPTLGGAITQHCLAAIFERSGESLPEGLGAVLRASHLGHEITLRWDAARPLAAGELFRVRKSPLSAALPFNAIGDRVDADRSFSETDPSTPLQFFELRVVDPCENLSLDEFPAGSRGD
jgi:hypothetical protein